ncbi:MAG TPA: hypothetical protein VNE38_06100 [Ktedonobacteraceae bacterium]|nr:hypothetical protein [Ktedonobacteraceae bacterium]
MLTELPSQSPTPPPPPQDVHHIGVIAISDTIIFHTLGISFDLIDTQGHLRDTGVFARIKETLLLPESYTVLVLVMRTWRIWWIGVESPDLPPVPDSEEPPEITPKYVREGDMVRLTQIVMQRDGREVNVLREMGAAREVNL